MEQHEAGGGRSQEGGDVGGGKLVDAFKIHLIVGPLQLVHEIQAAMYDERVHMSCLLSESGDTISALLGSAKLELKERLVPRADNAEVVGHVVRLRKETAESGWDGKGSGLLP